MAKNDKVWPEFESSTLKIYDYRRDTILKLL